MYNLKGHICVHYYNERYTLLIMKMFLRKNVIYAYFYARISLE